MANRINTEKNAGVQQVSELIVVFAALELDDFHTDPEQEQLSKFAVVS